MRMESSVRSESMVYRGERGSCTVDINRKAPAFAEKEIRIEATPQEVWKVHADINIIFGESE